MSDMEEEIMNKNWRQFEKTGCITDYLNYRGISPEEIKNSEGINHEGNDSSHGDSAFSYAGWRI